MYLRQTRVFGLSRLQCLEQRVSLPAKLNSSEKFLKKIEIFSSIGDEYGREEGEEGERRETEERPKIFQLMHEIGQFSGGAFFVFEFFFQ